MLQELHDLHEDGTLIGHYPVMFAYCCFHLQLKLEDVFNIFMYGVLRTVVGSAVRLGEIGSLEVRNLYVGLALLGFSFQVTVITGFVAVYKFLGSP